MRKINKDNRELFRTLSDHTGVNITTIGNIDAFYSTLFVEELKGLDIPEWGKPLKTDENFQYLYNLSFKAVTETDEMKRLRTGPDTKFLVNNINERVNNASMKTKLFMMSGHDFMVLEFVL